MVDRRAPSLGGDSAAHALDGNSTTRWTSGKPQYGDKWFRIDLGQATSLSQVWIDSNATDYASAYELDVSMDDATYARVTAWVGAASTSTRSRELAV